MVRIVLIRPGSTELDDQSRIQGNLDVPLNAAGQSEASLVAEELRSEGIEALYCSKSEPANETAARIGATLGLKPRPVPHMENLNHGLWQGMQFEEVKRKHLKVYRQWQEQPETVRPPQGETIGEAKERLQAALRKLLKKHPKGVIGLVVPEPAASMVRSCVLNCPVGDLWQAATDHGHWEILEVEPRAPAPTGQP